MKRFFTFYFLLIILSLFSTQIYSNSKTGTKSIKTNGSLAIVTYVGDYEQERKAVALLSSIRKNGGIYSEAHVYIYLGDPENYPCTSLKQKNVTLINHNLSPDILNYPLAIKAYSAAKAEELCGDDIKTLVWFDPETIVLGQFDELDTKGKFSASLKPVFLLNNIGLEPASQPNEYWGPIYKELNLDVNNIPVVETFADGKKIRAYYNCEVISVDPSLGIFRKWAEVMTKFLNDGDYQKTACKTFTQKLFLHQAILSAVITSRTKIENIRLLSSKCGYPYNLHTRLSDEKKITKLNSISVMIYESIWENDPNWLKSFEVDEPLKTWITNTYLDFLKVAPNIYRVEGVGNSYLVTTKSGSVLIDPAGAASAPQWFEMLIQKYPLKAILLTHGHNDHRDNISLFKKNLKIPVIAQRDIVEFIKYHDRLAGFFARRNAIWGRKPIPPAKTEPGNSPIEATVLFADNYTYKLGGLTFRMIHVGGETPDQCVIWIPQLKAAFVGDNYNPYTSFPNIYTLRGTKPRWALDYIAAQDTILKLKPEIVMPGHNYPWLNAKAVAKYVGENRDAIQYIHDETVKGMNEGKDVFTLMKEIKLPEKYNYLNQGYGRVSWTVRGIYEGYVGWFDENPASMYSESPRSIYSDLAALTSTDAILKSAEEYIGKGNLVKALNLCDAALSGDSGSKPALELKLKTLKDLRAKSRNYIENIWIDYGIRTTEAVLNNK